MIVSVRLEPTAFADLSAARLALAARQAQRTFAEAIRAHGFVVLHNTADRDAITAALRSETLSHDEKTRWRTLLAELIKLNRLEIGRPELEGNLSNVDSEAELASLADSSHDTLLVLQTDHFGSIFPRNSTGVETLNDHLAASVPILLSESPMFDKVRELEQMRRHPQGTARDEIWKGLFAPVARHSKKVAIFDHYLFNQLAWLDRERRSAVEHVVWLLDKLNREAPLGTNVKLYGGSGEGHVPESAEAIMRLIMSRWAPAGGNVVQLEVIAADLTSGRAKDLHDRHIRFGSAAGYLLHAGLDRLRSESVSSAEGFGWTYEWKSDAIDSMIAREQRLERLSGLSRCAMTL